MSEMQPEEDPLDEEPSPDTTQRRIEEKIQAFEKVLEDNPEWRQLILVEQSKLKRENAGSGTIRRFGYIWGEVRKINGRMQASCIAPILDSVINGEDPTIES